MYAGKIVVTGSAGLIGRALERRLSQLGYECVGIDTRSSARNIQLDICDIVAHQKLFHDVRGVIHLAAVSRVIDAQVDPEKCRKINVEGTRKLLGVLTQLREKPWFVYASSREVYGQQSTMPVPETAPLKPMNVYARSKREAEVLVEHARMSGVNSAIVRFSNVFGSPYDHATRVVPAFVRRALDGQPLIVEGKVNTFDFTFVEDVAHGLGTLVEKLCRLEKLPQPMHFVSGRETSLGELAKLVIAITRSGSQIVDQPPRTFDVSRFCGDPAYAEKSLGWRATTTIEHGIALLARRFEDAHHRECESNPSIVLESLPERCGSVGS